MELTELNLDQLLNRAETGDVEAQSLLGDRYYTGMDGARNIAAASDWYEQAAIKGNAKAQFNLGYIQASGEDGAPDLESAMRWYTMAAEQGLPDAQNNLGTLYEQNHQLEEAVYWYQLAADQGFTSAQASMGFALSQGRGVPIDVSRAIKYYQLAARNGSAAAQSNLGALYAEGRGTEVDPAAAAHWVSLAANQGHGPAQKILGDFYAQGFGLTTDTSEAAQWYLKAAVQGYPKAQNCLGILYATGNGVSEDHLMAYMWFAAAATQGDREASENKDRVPIDTSSQFCKDIEAAALGDVEALRNLYIRIHNGQGIRKSVEAANYWLRKAAESGDPWSQTTYALQLNRNEKLDIEREKYWWLKQAADQGDDRAIFNMGLRQFLGEGTEADPETAAVNIISSSLAGFEEARGAVEKIKPAISEGLWPTIFDRIKWPELIFIMGPLAEGILDTIRISQENDDGSDDAEWLKYEREEAKAMFATSQETGGSILDAAFGQEVTISSHYVGRSFVGGKINAAITIKFRDIQLTDGFPVYWKPSEVGMNAVTSLIGGIQGRTGIRWNYVSF
jgi:uncharacterized protein